MIEINNQAEVALFFYLRFSLLRCKVLHLMVLRAFRNRYILIKWQTMAAQIVFAILAVMIALRVLNFKSTQVALDKSSIFNRFFE